MRLLRVCLLGFALPAMALAEAPPVAPPAETPPTVSDDHRRLLEQLDAADYAVRRQALRQLRDLGPAGIPVLEAGAEAGRPGILSPTVELLERMFVEAAPDVADAAERALERLSFSAQSATSQQARAVLSGNQHIRTRRALAAIRELGGRVVFKSLDPALRNNPFWGMGGDSEGGIPGLPLATIHVWLLQEWAGGDEGLWHLTRLEDAWSVRIWKIEITNIRGSGVDQAAVQSLAARLPHLQTDERGAASLGIKCNATGECVVQSIVEGGAGHRSGLQQYDIIREMDGVPIANFPQLISILFNYQPDQVANFTVNRNGEDLEVPVKLGGWNDLDVSDPEINPQLLPDRRPPPAPYSR
ncbi:MAG: PDZ domain-containing protein [Planctomycetaceae bacterium]|nr:PDZ domain-containing protein [Planctomycetaceae bacterium]